VPLERQFSTDAWAESGAIQAYSNSPLILVKLFHWTQTLVYNILLALAGVLLLISITAWQIT